MKKKILMGFALLLVIISYQAVPALAQQAQKLGYILVHEKEVAKIEPGTHNGGGESTGYNFFDKAKDLKMVFKKRVLKPGAAIGYHLQKEDEIYYIISGKGEMQMNGKSFPVKAGDAILTRPGSSHGLKTIGEEDLTIIINYLKN
ncbi:cupin domain-containing protein [Zhouia sp. PK063]|uniref:cupin domain-containing protein n=1 Tax=Zhouia sp. PK063 TaxID=3373602 RepID=UPI00379DB808